MTRSHTAAELAGATVIGVRMPACFSVLVEYSPEHHHLLNPRLSWLNYSSIGFMWDFAGFGPAQLALALLGLVLTKNRALAQHRNYFWDVVAKLPHEGWMLPVEQIIAWCEAHPWPQQKPPENKP